MTCDSSEAVLRQREERRRDRGRGCSGRESLVGKRRLEESVEGDTSRASSSTKTSNENDGCSLAREAGARRAAQLETARVERREAAEDAEGERERFAAGEPAVAAEERHAGPRDGGIREHRRTRGTPAGRCRATRARPRRSRGRAPQPAMRRATPDSAVRTTAMPREKRVERIRQRPTDRRRARRRRRSPPTTRPRPWSERGCDRDPACRRSPRRA